MDKNQAKRTVSAFIAASDAVIVEHAVSMLNVADYVAATVDKGAGKVRAGDVWQSLGLSPVKGSRWNGTRRVIATLPDTSVSAEVIASVYQAVKRTNVKAVIDALKAGTVKPTGASLKGWTNAERTDQGANKRAPGGTTNVTLKEDTHAPSVSADSTAQAARALTPRIDAHVRDGVFVRDTRSALKALKRSIDAYLEADAAATQAAKDSAKDSAPVV